MPVSFNQSTNKFSIGDPTFVCAVGTKLCNEFIRPTLDFYKPVMFPLGQSTQKLPNISVINITMQTEKLPVDFNSGNESYSLKVVPSQIIIECFDLFGLARALASLSQLIFSNYDTKYEIFECQVQDKPKYNYRAVMVDSSRHFLPLSTLKRQMAALSLSKMNILHLHESDSQSFPLKTKTEPGSNFAKAAWVTAGEPYVHTLEQLKELAEYGKNIGVFLMLELDMPGHAASWYQADPKIVCACRDVIQPFNEKTYEHIESFLTDLFEAVFKPFGFNPIAHFGGDEVNSGCFASDGEVAKEMATRGFNSQQTWKYLHQRVVDIVQKIAVKMYPDRPASNFRVYWQESYSNGNNLSNGGVMHAWMSTHEMQKAASEGIFVIRSQGWYLDLNQPGGSQEYFVDSWQDFYNVDVTGGGIQPQQLHLVLGGGACQWGEKVHDGNIDEQIWPRSIAVAEVLWSNPQNRTITQTLKQRFNDLSCKIRQAGTESGAILPSDPCPGADLGREPLKNWRHKIDDVEDNLSEDDERWGWEGAK